MASIVGVLLFHAVLISKGLAALFLLVVLELALKVLEGDDFALIVNLFSEHGALAYFLDVFLR